MTHIPFFPWCCGKQEVTDCPHCLASAPFCLRVEIAYLGDFCDGYGYTGGGGDGEYCPTYTGIYFLQWYGTAYHFYCLDPAQRCGEGYYTIRDACIWSGYVCSPKRRCGPEPCHEYDRIAVVIGNVLFGGYGGYDEYVGGLRCNVILYDSLQAPWGLPGIPSPNSAFGKQQVFELFPQTDNNGQINCETLLVQCHCNAQTVPPTPGCLTTGNCCNDLSTCQFPGMVRVSAWPCGDYLSGCQSQPCESCCRGAREPKNLRATLFNLPSSLNCLDGWPHKVPLINTPNCTEKCLYYARFPCVGTDEYGIYGEDDDITVEVVRDWEKAKLAISADVFGAKYYTETDDKCSELQSIELPYQSGDILHVAPVDSVLRLEANAGGNTASGNGFYGICDQVCQPRYVIVSVRGFTGFEAALNGDYILDAGPTCRMYWFETEYDPLVYIENDPVYGDCYLRGTMLYVRNPTDEEASLGFNSFYLGGAFIVHRYGYPEYYGVLCGAMTYGPGGDPFRWDCTDLDKEFEADYISRLWGSSWWVQEKPTGVYFRIRLQL